MEQVDRTPGHELYVQWCDAPGTDQEAYWWSMNPAIKQDWERLAERLQSDTKRLEGLLERLQSEHDACPTHDDYEAMQGWRNLTQSELDDIAEVVGLDPRSPVMGQHGVVLARVRELATRAIVLRVETA